MNNYAIISLFIILIGVGLFLILNYNKPSTVTPEGLSIFPSSIPKSSQTAASSPSSAPFPTIQPVKELKIEEIKIGTGTEVSSGSSVTVNYIGRLTDGKVFDTSLQEGRQPFTFSVGAGQVIKGWDEGLIGMKIGGQRRLIIPPDKGYGATGAGGVIPPNATLVFDIELLDVK